MRRERKRQSPLIDDTLEAFGRLDVLVDNSGVYEFAPLEAITEDSSHDIADIAEFLASKDQNVRRKIVLPLPTAHTVPEAVPHTAFKSSSSPAGSGSSAEPRQRKMLPLSPTIQRLLGPLPRSALRQGSKPRAPEFSLRRHWGRVC